jgi:hypothetical protein
VLARDQQGHRAGSDARHCGDELIFPANLPGLHHLCRRADMATSRTFNFIVRTHLIACRMKFRIEPVIAAVRASRHRNQLDDLLPSHCGLTRGLFLLSQFHIPNSRRSPRQSMSCGTTVFEVIARISRHSDDFRFKAVARAVGNGTPPRFSLSAFSRPKPNPKKTPPARRAAAPLRSQNLDPFRLKYPCG